MRASEPSVDLLHGAMEEVSFDPERVMNEAFLARGRPPALVTRKATRRAVCKEDRGRRFRERPTELKSLQGTIVHNVVTRKIYSSRRSEPSRTGRRFPDATVIDLAVI